MNNQLEKQLFEKYPKIFAGKDMPITENLMSFGCECDDGWYWLIDNLCNTIQQYIDNNKHLNVSQVIATQVKEKYGGLRFYTLNSDDYVDGMIALAEAYSLQICEECGSTEDVFQTTGWVKTICKKCDTKIKNEKHISKESNTRKRSRKR